MILLNGKEIVFEKFPNGETRLDENQIFDSILENRFAHFTLKFEDDGDFIKLFLAKKIAELVSSMESLEIVYLPYSRMDRRDGGFVFTLKYICDFVNSLNFKVVNVLECHSDVGIALLNNCDNYPMSKEILMEAMTENSFNKEKDYIYYPDAGAEKRYSKDFAGYKSLVGMKTRDFTTGKITNLNVFGDYDLNGGNVYMIDDLCSYGGTFVLGAEYLSKINVGNIYLVVAHAEKSILDGKIPTFDKITKVYTTNSIIDSNNGIEKIIIKNVLNRI